MVDSRYGADSVQDKPGTSRHTRKQGHCWRLLESCQRDLGSPWRGFHWGRCDHLSFSNGNKHNIFKPKKIFFEIYILHYFVLCYNFTFSALFQCRGCRKALLEQPAGKTFGLHWVFIGEFDFAFYLWGLGNWSRATRCHTTENSASQVLSSIRSQDTFIVFFLKSYI